MKKNLLFLFLASCIIGNVWGNGVVLSNLSSVPGTGFVQLKFDLTWNNSWNNNVNYDAAWVFFKFKDTDGNWRHLNVTGNNNSIAAGFSAEVPPDKTGIMIHRNIPGLGTVTLTNITVGVVNLPGAFDVKGFAMEMVSIPLTDSFFVGAGNNNLPGFKDGISSDPFFVYSNTITMGPTSLNVFNSNSNGFTTGSLAPGFPIGYSTQAGRRMYMMKHEISQAAYRDFLNTLTYTQQQTRTGTAPSSAIGTQAMIGSVLFSGQGIQVATSGINASQPAVYGCNLNNNATFDEADDGEWVGAGYLNWQDLAAFLDWTAMRPMTELEFEKSCRGPLTPVMDELAAGTPLQNGFITYSNIGTAFESAIISGNPSVMRTNVTSGISARRVGIYATANSTRISAGAGYYGALDLSGNISELMVTLTDVAGRSYTGLNGDGILTTSGDANVDFWPGIGGNVNHLTVNTAIDGFTGVTGYAGYTTMGGGGSSASLLQFQTSFLFANVSSSVPTRLIGQGGRGVKSW